IFYRRTPATDEVPTGPSAQPQDDAFAYIVRESPSLADAETGTYADLTYSGGDTEILQFDPGKTPKSRPLPEQEFVDEDQVGPDPGESRVALAGSNPKPMHDDFMANVYPNVHESLKFLANEHVIIKEPLSLTRTLSLMKNLDDAYTIGDQFLNDKSTEDDPRKLNVEAKVLSIVTVPIYQASSSALPLSTPVIDLSPAKLIYQTINEVVKEAADIAFQASLRDRFRELPEADMKEILHQRMDEFFVEKDKSRKRRHDDQDPLPPPPDSDPIEDVPIADTALTSDSKETDFAHLPKIKPRPEWLKPMEECHRLLTDQVDLVNPEGHQLVPDLSKLIPLRGPPGQVGDLQLSIESYQTKLNLIEPRWDASDFLFKEDYTIISKPKAVIYRDRNDQKKMLRENEYNSGMEYRIWSEDDKRRSEAFMEVIKRRLKI
nr:hypothetical protein [Tanacetum cinerariifolium]